MCKWLKSIDWEDLHWGWRAFFLGIFMIAIAAVIFSNSLRECMGSFFIVCGIGAVVGAFAYGIGRIG
jgi:prolipoprotein diacylglyceryltransferase